MALTVVQCRKLVSMKTLEALVEISVARLLSRLIIIVVGS